MTKKTRPPVGPRGKRPEPAPAEGEAKFQALFAAMTEGVALHELVLAADGTPEDYVILDVNPAYERITGIPRERAVGRRASELYGTGQPPYLDVSSRVALGGSPESFETHFAPLAKSFSVHVYSPGEGQFAVVFFDITERKRVEEELRESEERFRVVLRNSPVFVAQVDRELRYVWAHNPLLDLDPAAIVGKPVGLAVDPANAARMTASLRRVVAGGEKAQWEAVSATDAGRRHFQCYAEPWRDLDGNIVGASLLAADITDRKRSEEELRLTQERTAAILEGIADTFYSLDSEWRFTIVNPAAERAPFGRPAAELLGQVIWDLYPGLVGTRIQQHYLDAAAKLCLERYEAQSPLNGRWYEVFMQGWTGGVDVYMRDITARKSSEEALRELNATLERRVAERTQDLSVANEKVGAERQRFYDVLETLPAYVCLLTPDYYMPFANRTFRELFGESGGKRCFEFLFHRTEPCESCDTYTVLRTDRPHRWEWTGPNVRTYDVFDFPFLDTDGSTMILEMGVDITEQRKAEDALRERTEESERRAEQLGALAAELTRAEERERRRLAEVLHDELQQLLAAAKIRASVVSNPEDRREIVDLLAQCIATSRSVTAELSPPILYDGDLPTALEGLARRKRDKLGIDGDLQLDPAADPGTLEGRLLLFRGARELLINAVKHARVPRATLTLRREANCIKLSVADEGPGFDPNDAAPGEGGGFGLFSLRERFEPLGGRVEVDSAPGRGAQVTLVLPVLEKRTEAASEPDADAPDRLPLAKGAAAIRVLVVDDHAIVRQGLVGLLRDQEDIEVVGEAGDGLAAVDMARRLRPDAIVMDVNMPRMNGLEATRAILAETPQVSIIGLSVHSEEDMGAKMREAGACAYLDKSGPGEALIAAIRACRL